MFFGLFSLYVCWHVDDNNFRIYNQTKKKTIPNGRDIVIPFVVPVTVPFAFKYNK